MNRLRWEWKKNPWQAGQTIDLGVFEERFQSESGIARLDAGVRVPPAVLDWLRWRYRRLRIDRRRDEEWLRVLREDYPRRVREAGPRPSVDTASHTDTPGPLWRAERVGVGSKRQRRDAPRVVPEPPTRELQERTVPDDMDENALALMVAEHRGTLAPLLDKCRSEKEQRALILALREYVAAPADGGAGACWREAVTELWSRG